MDSKYRIRNHGCFSTYLWEANWWKPSVVACHAVRVWILEPTTRYGYDLAQRSVVPIHLMKELVFSSQKFWKFLLEILENIPVKYSCQSYFQVVTEIANYVFNLKKGRMKLLFSFCLFISDIYSHKLYKFQQVSIRINWWKSVKSVFRYWLVKLKLVSLGLFSFSFRLFSFAVLRGSFWRFSSRLDFCHD
jgi:hypothetical protein